MTHSELPQRTRLFTVIVAFLTVALLAVFAAPNASAISDAEELTSFGGKGSGAGQLSGPNGIATDPVAGHVFVADNFNNRISEFTAWGNFVKAFGWDVAPGAVNEQQEVRVRASAGQFKLTFGASTTTDLAFDAPGSADDGAGSVEAALNALPTLGGAGGEVSVKAVPGTPDGKTPAVYVVTFKGSLAATNVAELTIANGTTSLSGGVPSTVLEARTRAEGTAGGVGLESCTEESGCKAGLQGSGAGQLNDARGVAVDAAGNVYVKEVGNLRVQKFDSAGRFLLMFGGEVNETTNENICTKAQLEGGDVCGIGVAGSGDGQFGASNSPAIALDAGGDLFVGDVERIQRFNQAGEWQSSIPVSAVSDPPTTVHRLAIAPASGDFYALVGPPIGTEQYVRILDDATGTETGKLEAAELDGNSASKATGGVVATDPFGNVFTRRNNLSRGVIVQFDPAGKQTSEFGKPEPAISSLAANSVGTLYAASDADGLIRAFGSAPLQFEGPPPVPPTISDQYASSAERTGAVLGAAINPHFWSDTRFYVQYGTGKCSEGGCTSEKPLAPGARLTTKQIDAPLKSPAVFLEGLKTGTTYHFRFVAESLGGGPVRGIGGEVGVDGEESSFTTYPAQSLLKADCPNQAFRSGFSAPLPDCRAYEMVSPIDKNNGDIQALVDVTGYSTAFERSSVDGNRFTYSSYRAFANPKAAPFMIQYLANREDGVGWSSESIVPPQGHTATRGGAEVANFENLFKAFSSDLCKGWLVVAAEPLLAPGASEEYRHLYRRDNCGPGGYETLSVGEPSVSADAFYLELQGVSADSEKAIFRANGKLTEDAASGVWQTYYASEGGLRLLCVLPNGTPNGGNCSAGTGGGGNDGSGAAPAILHRNASVTNAFSTDGSHVYWTASPGDSGPGKVYLRLNPDQEQSTVSGGECGEAEKACTLKVSETVSTKNARFLGASPDGAKALFEITEGLQEGSIYLFDSEGGGGSTLIAAKGLGIAGSSDDLSRIYFFSEEVLAGGAQAGEPNLYLDERGTKTFIATLADADMGKEISNNSHEPIYHVARVSPDGGHLAFISTESLTGYDSTDQVTGQADTEVYLYQAGALGPVCVSCNPSGARPQGRVARFTSSGGETLPIAAMLPPAQFTLYFPNPLSADGSHLFFNSFDPLLPRDTNGKADVYQWQAASSESECKEKGAELYVASSAGCLSLISSGQSPSDSKFLDASPSGRDVFFTTNANLLPQDPGLIDVYDARENGGLPGPPEPPGPCQGEACQFAPPPPNDPTPASASFKGAGNLKPTPRCRKGKVARKGRCVAKKRKAAKRHAKRANHNRGTAR